MKTQLEKKILKEILKVIDTIGENLEGWIVQNDSVSINGKNVPTDNVTAVFYNAIRGEFISRGEIFFKQYLKEFTSVKGEYFAESLMMFESYHDVLGYDYWKDLMVYSIVSDVFSKLSVDSVINSQTLKDLVSKYNG